MNRKMMVLALVSWGRVTMAGAWVDTFPGTTLGTNWQWNHMGSCQGSEWRADHESFRRFVGWRQSGIVTSSSNSWVWGWSRTR